MRPQFLTYPTKAIVLFIGILPLCLLIGCGGGSTSSGTATTDSSTPKIQVSPSNPTLYPGQSLQLKATAVYQNGTQQDVTNSTTWQSSATTVAAVGNTGSLTAMGVGSAQVTALYQGASGTSAVTVNAATLQTITVTPSSSSLPAGETQQLSATGTYSDGSTKDLTASVTWVSSQQSVAGVNAAGMITANAVGSSTISANTTGIVGSAQVTVTSAVTVSLSISPSTLSMFVGGNSQLAATATFSNGTQQNVTGSSTWTTSAGSVASVGSSGNLTGMGVGSAQVTAQYQGLSATSGVTVNAVTLQSIAVSPSASSVPIGESQQLSATGTYSDGSTQNLTATVIWASSQPSMVAVTGKGAVTANALGTSTLTATTSGISGSAQVTATPAVAVSLAITPATLSMIVGSNQQLQATYTFSDGTTQNATSQVLWSSDTPAVLSVTDGGAVAALQVGTANISASGSQLNADAPATVVPLALVSYFDLASAQTAGIDGTLRLTNPGLTGGDLCAMVYVFDSNQEMNECCGCIISDAGLIELSLENDLTSNTLTGTKPSTGTIRVVPSDPTSNPQCNASSLAPTGQILGWETNVSVDSNNNVLTLESSNAAATLTNSESSSFAATCAAIQSIGSGQGVCSCGTGDTTSSRKSLRYNPGNNLRVTR